MWKIAHIEFNNTPSLQYTEQKLFFNNVQMYKIKTKSYSFFYSI